MGGQTLKHEYYYLKKKNQEGEIHTMKTKLLSIQF